MAKYSVKPKHMPFNPLKAMFPIIGLLEFIADRWECQVTDKRSGKSVTGYGKSRNAAKQDAFRRLRQA
jgi:hypothetical protein